MKCFEKILSKQLLSEVSSSLDPDQFAYRVERGVEDALLTLTINIFEHLERAQSLVKIVFIDFSSAFNTIQPHLMVSKQQWKVLRGKHRALSNGAQIIILRSTLKKIEEMVIDFSKNKITVPPAKIKGELVERVPSYKNLGVEIDDHLKFSVCAQSKSNKLQQRLFFLRKLNHFRVESCILLMFYNTVLQSVLSFGLI